MAKMPETAKFCTPMFYMEGEEVFVSQKPKSNMLLGNE